MATGFDGFGTILGLLTPDSRQFSIATFSNNVWNEPAKLPPQDDPGYLMQFRFRFDQNGNSMFVWSAMEVYRSIQHIYAAQFNVETGWGKIEEVESFSDISSAELEAKFDNHNNLLVVWRNEDQGSLWSSYYSSNDNLWLKEEAIGNSAFAGEKYLQFTSDDQAVLFWREHPNMLFSRSRNGQNWEKPIQLNLAQTTGAAIALNLLTDYEDNLYAIWYMDLELCICQINNDQAIGLPDCIDLGESGTFPEFRSAINSHGDIMVIWTAQDEDGRYLSLYGTRYVEGVGWEQPQLLENHSGSVESHQIRFDDKDNAILVWERHYSERADSNIISLYTKKCDALSGWEEEKQLWVSSVPLGGHNATPRFALDSAGNAFCVWLETIMDPIEPVIFRGVSIWLSSLPTGGEWNHPEIIKSGNFSSYPLLAVDDSGMAIVCWQEQDRVFAKTYN